MAVGADDVPPGRDGTGVEGAPDRAPPATSARPAFTRPVQPPRVEARPRVVEDPGILGLSRRARSRFGSRLFTLFFVLVFAVILIQLVVSLLSP